MTTEMAQILEEVVRPARTKLHDELGLSHSEGTYPLAIQPMIEQGLRRFAHDAEQMKKFTGRINKLLQIPLFQYRPLPRALEFHKSDARYRWSLGGNRSSKSESLAYEVAYYATGNHPFKNIKTPNVGWYCTITWEMVGTILMEKLHRILDGWEIDVQWRNRAKGIPSVIRVRVAGGAWSSIVFKAYEQGRDIFQGTERRYIANDEQFPHDVYLEQISRVGSGQRLDFMAALTPIKPQPWLEGRLAGHGDPIPDNWKLFKYPLDDNRISEGGFIDDSEIDALIEEWPEEIVETRRLGEWGSHLGAVYKSFNRAVHVVPTKQEENLLPGHRVPHDLRSVRAIDFGANNPFVCLWAVRLPCIDNEWYVYDEYYWNGRTKGVALMSQHAGHIKSVTLKWKTSVRETWADHDAQDRAELANAKIPTSPAKKDIINGIECVQTYLKIRKSTKRPRLHIAARCVNTIRELSTYRWPDGSENRDPAERPVELDDHCPDALRYLLYSEEVTAINFISPSTGGTKRRF